MKTVKIRLLNAFREVEYKEVPCLYYTKLYSVTRTYNNDEIPTYTITHNKTGQRVVSFSNFNKAKEFCKEVNIKWCIEPKDKSNLKEFHNYINLFVRDLPSFSYYLSPIRE